MKKLIKKAIIVLMMASMSCCVGCSKESSSSRDTNKPGVQVVELSKESDTVSSHTNTESDKKSEPDNPDTVLTKRNDFFALPYDGIAVITKDNQVSLTYVDDVAWDRVDEAKTWTNIASLAAGYKNLFGLKSDGTVAAVGNNDSNQCNVSGWKNVVLIDASFEHTVGLCSDGTAYAMGKNTDNRCLVNSWKDLIDISAGYSHTVGLQKDGTVLVTGGNEWGQSDISDWKNMKMISAGYYHTVGLQDDGTVIAKGSNKFGQCDVNDWKDVTAVYAGKMHTVALKNDGTVLAAGNNDYGQCDVSAWNDVKELYVEKNYTVGKTTAGEILVAGLCFYDQDISDRKYYLKDYQEQLTVTSAEPAPSPDPEPEPKPTQLELNTAYRASINDLVAKCGKPCIHQSYYSGAAFLKLIDFDGDGTEELYCAYSQDKHYPDMQEIYGYQNGKAVSLFKGKTNLMDISIAGGGPYIEMAEQNGRHYILSEEIIYDNSTDEGQWIGIENHSAQTVSADSSFQTRRTYFSLGNHQENDFIADSKKLMQQFGCDTSGIINAEEYDKQFELYLKYTNSEAWKTFSRENGPRMDAFDKYARIYYDFDGDSTLEMWFQASVSQSFNGVETLSMLCTIKDGKVEELLKAGECGGSMGGDYVTLIYNEETDQLTIGTYRHVGGFGGYYGALVSYDYADGNLEKRTEYSGTVYNEQPPEYTINGKNVSEEEYTAFAQKYYHMNISNAEKLLFYTAPTTSVRDRLVELKVIH